MSDPKILVADDRPDDAALVSDILTTANYQVITAIDGEDALAKVYSEHPELVILDIRMPKLDGYQVCQKIKADPVTMTIPVMLLTSTYRDSTDKVRGFEAGADDYVTQPIGHRELIARVTAMLRVKSLYDERVRQQETLEKLTEELQKTNTALREANEELARLAVSDPLTGLYTRQHYYERLDNEIGRAKRFHHPLSVVRVDIDGFRELNARLGSPSGDAILRGVAATIRGIVRAMDIVARTGGDEFAFILPETDTEGARSLATRLCESVAGHSYLPDVPQQVTVSLGVAKLILDDGETAPDLMVRAERAIERARSGGGNSVRVAD